MRDRAKVITLSCLIAFAIALSILGVWLWHRWAEENCKDRVQAREDARSMFVWIGEAFGDGESEFVPAMVHELDVRLPALRCVDNRPVPVDPADS